MNLITDWFRQHFSDPQVVILAMLLIVGTVIILFLGNALAPVLASVVVAYLLAGLVGILERRGLAHTFSVTIVFITFMLFILVLLLFLFPLLWKQMGQLLSQLPSMVSWSQRELLRLPERFPDYISEQDVLNITNMLRKEITTIGEKILTVSVASIRSVISVLVYLFLMPILVFFFLKDHKRLIQWLNNFLPEDRRLASEVWQEVDQQIGNYIRGKFWEIIIVWTVSFITFFLLGLDFAMLISFFIGLSVLIPYIGAIVMTLPVALIGYFQWGLGPNLFWVIAAYLIIQILDGNVLVTFLFSEVVNLHPVAIIVAVLVFGGVFGFWGVFFAIPLATLVQAVLGAWTRNRMKKVAEAKQKVVEETVD